MPGVKEPAGQEVRQVTPGEGNLHDEEGLSKPSLNGSLHPARPEGGTGAALRRYSLALAATFIATVIRLALGEVLEDRAIYPTFFIAVAITSAYGGLGPALVAMVLGGVAAAWFFVAPAHEVWISNQADLISLISYLVVSLTFAVVGETRQSTLRKERRASKELHRSQQNLSDFFENAAVGLHWVGPDGTILRANQAELDMLGYTRGEYIGRNITDFHVDEPVITDILKRLTCGETLSNYEARLRCKDGSIKYVVINSNVLFEEGEFVHTRCFTRDITEQRLAEQSIRDNEQRFKLALANGTITVYQQDLDLRYLWLHPPAGREGAMGKTDGELMPDKEEAVILEGLKRRVLQTQQGLREEIKVTMGGPTVYYDLIVEPIYDSQGKLSGIGGAALDITERKRFQEALLESREAERRFQEQLTALHLVEDELSMAPTVEKICRLAVTLAHSRLGFERISIWLREGEGSIRGTYGVDETGKVRDERNSIVEVGPTSSMGRVLSGEMQTICVDDANLYNHRGEVVGQGCHCVSALWDGTRVIGAVSIDNLITREPIEEQRRELLNLFATNLGHLCSRKEVEEALRESDYRYRSFVEQSTEAIWRVELKEPVDTALPEEEQLDLFYRDGYLAECNDAMAQMYGLQRADEIRGAALGDLLVRENPDNVAYLRAFIKSGYKLHDAESVERDGQGLRKYFLNNLVGIVEGGKLIRAWGTQRDVTERRNMEEELRESEQRLSLALEAGRMGIWDWNIQTGELQWSSQLEPIHGFEPGTFDGSFETFASRIHPEDRQKVQDDIQHAITSGKDFYTEFRVTYPDGSTHWVAGTGKAFYKPDGQPERMIGVGLDISSQREAQEELRVSEERFRRMVDQSPLSVQILAPDGHTLRVNQAWQDLWGATMEMLEGYNMLEDEQLVERGIMPHIKRAFDGEAAQIPATPYVPAFGQFAGHERWTRAFVYPVRAGEKIREVVLIHEDITEQRKAEEALRENEQRFRLIFENSMYPILIADDSGRYVDANEAASELLGVSKEELLTMQVADLQTPHEGDAANRYQHYLTSGRDSGEFEFNTPNGQRRVVEYSASRFAPGLHLSILRDITERKVAEEEIRQLNLELEQRVEQRTAQLSAANRELEGFSYSVSHDLRTPLRSISGFSKVLLDDYGDRLDDEARDYLHRIMNAGFRMTDMIDDLLQYSRLGRREMRMERVDLSQIGKEVVAEIQRRHPDGSARFDIASGISVSADPQLLRVVMENLLDNAYKFASKAAEPVISFGTDTRDGEQVFFVRDNGIGFDPQYLGKLFQPFERLHRTTDYPGTGIGLANVQRIIHRHNGKVWAEGELGKGATFFFTLGTH